jgi:hypothetical protein
VVDSLPVSDLVAVAEREVVSDAVTEAVSDREPLLVGVPDNVVVRLDEKDGVLLLDGVGGGVSVALNVSDAV